MSPASAEEIGEAGAYSKAGTIPHHVGELLPAKAEKCDELSCGRDDERRACSLCVVVEPTHSRTAFPRA